MSKTLEVLAEDASLEATVGLLLQRPGRYVWVGLDGKVNNPFFSSTSLRQIEQWLLNDHHTALQILVASDHSLVRAVPQLRELIQHLSSRIEVRVLGSDSDTFSGDWHIQGEWLLTDRGGVLYRSSIENNIWQSAMHAPAAMRRLQRAHAQIWEHATPSAELRSMTI